MKRKLSIPRTDLTVTPIGLGTAFWQFDMTGRMMDAFLDMGGQVIDTARLYGFPDIGLSERCIGQWIHDSGRRYEIVLMTKGGHPDVSTMHISRMTAADMEADLTESLRALQTDHIDIYFYHRDNTAQPVGELLEQMEQFRQAGKIRYYACSNWTTARMQEADAYAAAHDLRGFIGNECMYNLGAPSAKPQLDDTLVTGDGEMLTYHRHSDNVMMPYSGLANGFFHKLMKAEQPETLSDSIYYTPENLRNAAVIRRVQETYHASVTQVLTGWFYTLGLPVLPLIGCSSIEHLADVMGALELPFTAEDFA